MLNEFYSLCVYITRKSFCCEVYRFDAGGGNGDVVGFLCVCVRKTFLSPSD